MALNLSKKTECLTSEGDDEHGSSDEGTEHLSDSISSGRFQPLDLSLKTPTSLSKAQLKPQMSAGNVRKRMLPSWGRFEADGSQSPRSTVEDETIVVDDEDSELNSVVSKLFEDSANENGVYVCHYCAGASSTPVIFQSWASIQAHYQNLHPNERPYACPLAPSCPYTAKWFCDMRIHFKQHHPDIASSARQMYDAVQLVKDRATLPLMLLPSANDRNSSPASSSSPPSSTDNLLMLANKLPLLMNGSNNSSAPLFSSPHQSLIAFPGAVDHNLPNATAAQKTRANSTCHSDRSSNDSILHHQSSTFWTKAVGQQPPKGDLRSVKAIKIDCKSVYKALNNHRQQEQQMQQASPLRSMAQNQQTSSPDMSNTPIDATAIRQNGSLPPVARSIPYKFQCPLCNYRTQRQTNFECHVACHENLRIYKCSACAYRSNWKWDLKKHIRQVHPIEIDGEICHQPADKIAVGKMDDSESIDGGESGGCVEGGAARILVMPLEEARRTVDTYLKQVGKSAEKFLLKCVLCPFVTKRRKLLTRHHQQTHGLRPDETCTADDFVVALPSSPESAEQPTEDVIIGN